MFLDIKLQDLVRKIRLGNYKQYLDYIKRLGLNEDDIPIDIKAEITYQRLKKGEKVSGRMLGKTTALIKLSAETGNIIVCFSLQECKRVFYLSRDMNLDIPHPVTIDQIYHGKLRGKETNLYLDDRDLYQKKPPKMAYVFKYHNVIAETTNHE